MNAPASTLKKRNGADLICMALFCGFCTLLNLAGAKLAEVTGAPLYLDSVGTIISAVCGGYLPGVAVAFVTTMIRSLSDHEAMYYNVVGMLTAVCAAFFARKGVFKKKLLPLLTAPVYAVVAGVLDSVLTRLLYTADATDQYEGLEAFFRDDLGMKPFLAQTLLEIITELEDKAICIAAAVLVMALLPKRIKGLMKPNSLWQAPLSDRVKQVLQKKRCRSVSLGRKVAVIVSVLSILIAGTVAVISTILYRKSNISDKQTLANGVTQLAANYIDPESVDDFIENGENAEGYSDVYEKLRDLRDCYPTIKYLYVYKIEEDGCRVVFDIDEPSEASSPGDLLPFDDSFKDLIPDLLAGKEIDPVESDDSYGWLLSVYRPVYNDSGECVCYAAADVKMDDIYEYEKTFIAKLVSLMLGFSLLIVVVCLWLVKHNVILPANTMAYCAEKFAFDGDEGLERGLERMKSLDIRTGDEMEDLYKAFVKTMSDSLAYISDIKEKSETISKMQNGLVMVLADMVESRDKCTGDHVRKTSAYVKLIMEKMREMGMYNDQLDEEFINNVMNAAPLHDIGKIHISDVVLNKPARLTDEEFEKMKTHTTLGGKIIDRVIEMTQDSDYLREAKNLSEYHHEKWNGKGYPHGLSGEDIPLSARIMAVADVFDALVSRRSYKEPFSFEKAMEIIQNDAGSHFDPKVAEAFKAAEDDARKIAESFAAQSPPPEEG